MLPTTPAISDRIFTVMEELIRKGNGMFERLEKYREELAKAKARRADLDAKIKDLERKCKEEENAQIHGMVHAMNMTPEQLQKVLTKAAEGKLWDDNPETSKKEPAGDAMDEDWDDGLSEEDLDEDFEEDADI